MNRRPPHVSLPKSDRGGGAPGIFGDGGGEAPPRPYLVASGIYDYGYTHGETK
jgi:hypothetical protein